MSRGVRADPQDVLFQYFSDYVTDGRLRAKFLLRNPRRLLSAIIAMNSLPVLRVELGSSSDSARIRNLLSRPMVLRSVLRGTVACLEIPSDPGAYELGGARKRLRQEVRHASRSSVRFREVTSADERTSLEKIATLHERTSAVELLRNPLAVNEDMLDCRIWEVGEDASGAPLLLAVAAVDGSLAVLRYYRTLAHGRQASAARYAAMPVLVDRLRASGVQWLLEPGRPHWLHNGVRMFQHKVGFRYVRLHIAGGSRIHGN